jgi:acetyltransferase
MDEGLFSAFRRLRAASEHVALDDGRAVTILPVTPEAKPLIARAIERVSPESSRRRFFTVRRRFSDRELDDMTRLDGWHRYALGAVGTGPEGPEGAAVARFARVAGDASTAEIALLVVDHWQGAGLGRRMLARISAAARKRGIDRLTGLVMRDNEAMLTLLRRRAPGLDVADAGDNVRVTFPSRAPTFWEAILAA